MLQLSRQEREGGDLETRDIVIHILCQLMHNTSLSPIHSKPNQAGYALSRELKLKYAHAQKMVV